MSAIDDGAIDPPADPDLEEEQSEEIEAPEEQETAAEDPGQQPQSDDPRGLVFDPTIDDHFPEEARPWVSSTRSYITQLEQDRAAQRAFLDDLQAAGLTPEVVQQTLRQYRQNPAAFAQPQAQQQGNPLASDPDLIELQGDVQAAIEQYGERSLEARQAHWILQQEIRIKTIDLRDADRERRQAERDRTQEATSELIRLKSDPRFKAALADPQTERAVIDYAARHNIPVEDAAKAKLFDQVSASSFVSGRSARERAKGASLTAGRPSNTVVPVIPDDVRRKGVRAIGEFMDAHPETEWSKVDWQKERQRRR